VRVGQTGWIIRRPRAPLNGDRRDGRSHPLRSWDRCGRRGKCPEWPSAPQGRRPETGGNAPSPDRTAKLAFFVTLGFVRFVSESLSSLRKRGPFGRNFIGVYLTRTSRNQKGKVAQGVACQRQEKRDKREAFPTATFPRAYFSRMWLDCSIHLQKLELSHGRTAF
jgi:hypothetical protein